MTNYHIKKMYKRLFVCSFYISFKVLTKAFAITFLPSSIFWLKKHLHEIWTVLV